jgi:hypothetical protein
MEYRAGKCSKCGAEYKIPTSFAHDVARCKECGGTVRIAKVGESAPAVEPPAPAKEAAPVPARKVAEPPRKPEVRKPAPKADKPEMEAHVPSGKKGGGPSMLDQLRARQGEEEAPQKAPAPAKSSPAKVAKPTGAAKSTGSRSSTKARAGGSSRSRTGRGGSSKSEGSGRRSRRPKREKPEKKVPMPAILSIAAIVLLCVAAWLLKDMFTGSTETTDPTEVAATETPAETTEETVEEAPAVVEEQPVDEPEPEPEPVEETEPEPTVFDPASVDLSEIENFNPTMGCTEEKWGEMVGWMATFMDLDAGAKGNRAGLKLQNEGRIAIPVIINAMKLIDFSTEEGFRKGDMCQKTLERICRGANFGWKYSQDDEGVVFNKKVVRSWSRAWAQADSSIEAWIKMASLDKKAPKEAKRLRAEFGEGAPAAGLPGAVIDDEDLDVD